jgi:hypothetical protein
MEEESKSKKSSFSAPAIASKAAPHPSSGHESLDMSRDGVQGDLVVTKGRAATFVTGVTKPTNRSDS